VTKHRPVALITGASVGLGAAFARELCRQGYDLVLVARDSARLDELAAELRGSGREVEALSADLATEAGCAAVVARIGTADRPVDLLVNNAGKGMYEPFGERPLVDEEGMLDLNVRAVLRLSHAAIRAMRARGQGQIINVSSVASLVPRGFGATYAASKAWVTAFSEDLSQQLGGTGVRVTAVCPGFVHTEFHQRAGIGRADVPGWMWLDAELVVRTALADAARGKPVSIPGRQWKTMIGLSRSLPRPALRRIMRGRSL
jgi:uncharacterized protein